MQRMFAVACLCLIFLAGGCARKISQNYYKASSIGEASHTYKGQIISARKVEVGESENLQGNSMGIAAGGIGGALLGSQIGGGSTANLIGGALGAVAGGVGGAFAEKALSEQEGMEYSVQLDNGQLMTIVQGVDEVYAMGQRVLVIVSHSGRSRVVPDNSVAMAPRPVQAPAQYAPAPVQNAPAPVQYAQPQPVPVQYVHVHQPAQQPMPQQIPQAHVNIMKIK